MKFQHSAAFAFAFAFAVTLSAQDAAQAPAEAQTSSPEAVAALPAAPAEKKAEAPAEPKEVAQPVGESAPAEAQTSSPEAVAALPAAPAEKKAEAPAEPKDAKVESDGPSVIPEPAVAPASKLNQAAKAKAVKEHQEAFPPDMKVDEKFAQEEDITSRYPDARGPEQAEEAAETSRDRKPVYRLNRPIRYVLLVSNYHVPRMFAERARVETGTPYILLPANEAVPDENTILYFVPRLDEGICPIKAKDLSAFLAFLRPRNVVVLGDGSYVSALYRRAVPETCGLIEFSDPDWKINAIRLDNLLEMRDTLYNLHQEYAKGKMSKPEVRNTGIGY